MDEIVLDVNILVLIVTKILQRFDEWNLNNSVGKTKYRHIDVTLTRNGANYAIQATNYGPSANNILRFFNEIFREFVKGNVFRKNAQIATIYTRNKQDRHAVTGLRFTKKCFSLTRRTKKTDESQIDFTHRRNYLSLQLQNKLRSSDLEEFSRTLLKEIVSLQRLTTSIETKFTVHCDRSVIYNNHISLDDDYKSCRVLATALTNIIKHSVNVEFKVNCFSTLRVNNSHDVEAAVMVKLLPLIHENYTFPDDN
ncbi:uncharacterized protein LOC117219748 [Megalopta genalis]|uniref:uncharacterized protein LOC117219748 n=1 Tax=Megalopta genalis TaxID=115081 RepID=UPI003FD20433